MSLRMNSTIKIGEGGFALLESLIGILIFTIAVIGLIRMQSSAISTSNEATYRSEASYLADQIIGLMWLDRANLPNYQLNAGAADCAAGSNLSGNAVVSGWLSGFTLPGSSGITQKISVDQVANLVTVVICWKPPKVTSPHKVVATTSIN